MAKIRKIDNREEFLSWLEAKILKKTPSVYVTKGFRGLYEQIFAYYKEGGPGFVGTVDSWGYYFGRLFINIMNGERVSVSLASVELVGDVYGAAYGGENEVSFELLLKLCGKTLGLPKKSFRIKTTELGYHLTSSRGFERRYNIIVDMLLNDDDARFKL